GWIIEPLLKALELFFRGDVKKTLQNGCLVFNREQPLEIIDQIEAFRPLALGDQTMHSYRKYVFVMGAIEYRNRAFRGNVRMHTPDKVVGKFFGRGLFESCYRTCLRIHAGQDVPDYSVLARSIQTLEHDEERVLAFRVH